MLRLASLGVLAAVAGVTAALALTAAPPLAPVDDAAPEPSTTQVSRRPAAVEPGATGPDTYRFVEIAGRFRAEHPPGSAGVCGFPSTPEVDRAARTVRFWNERVDANATAGLALAVVWDSSLCGTASTSVDARPSTAAPYRVAVDGVGEMEVVFLEGGVVRVHGHEIQPGEELTLAESGTRDGPEGPRAWSATYTITNHGSWPRAGLASARL